MTVLMVGLATPANAAETIRWYSNQNTGTNLGQSTSGPLRLLEDPLATWWYIQQISDSPSGHDRVFLKTATSGGKCVDSHGARNGGDAWNVSCNGGDYQIWEVFYQTDGTRVFKSWGAWTKQNLHLCLAADQRDVIMATCNEGASRQRWYSHTV